MANATDLFFKVVKNQEVILKKENETLSNINSNYLSATTLVLVLPTAGICMNVYNI